jgi:YQGE family putative transporter
MKSKNIEGNIIIAINAMKKIMVIFLGPFLTAYFIKTSQESIIDLSIYYIFSYILLAIGTFIVANIIKNKFRIGMFRIGVILNFFYIMSIIVLKEKIINHLEIISVLYGISSSAYWFPYNLFVINKIDNNERTEYTVKSKIVSSVIGILCPILLGSIITATNYELTAVIILFISLIQIILSFMLMPKEEKNLPKFNFKNTWNKLKNNKQIRKMSIVEFFIGMNVSDGALEVLMTVLIFNSFKTNMNLGIITSITTVLSMICVHMYGKIYKNRDDKKIIIISSILPVISVLILLVWRNNITVIIYNVCYVIFTSLLTLTREIRLFNLSDSYIVDKNNQCEFFAIREGILNCGRVFGYLMLLLAGVSGSNLVLNVVMVLLTLSIFIMGLNIRKIEKFEK